MLGSHVNVYDRGLASMGQEAGQVALNKGVATVLHECIRLGLLELAGIQPPPREGFGNPGPWHPYDGEPERVAHFHMSPAKAAKDAELVIEAVPDDLKIKSDVFAETARTARPGALLATSTLSLTLANIQASVLKAINSQQQQRGMSILPSWSRSTNKKAPEAGQPRVVGLRFLAPVVFVPFVEVTLTKEQEEDHTKEDLLALLSRWGKSAFICDVQGAADGVGGRPDDPWEASRRSAERLRLDTGTAARRQAGEARLRRAHHAGKEAVEALSSTQLFGFEEERCCICLDQKPSASSIICGHTALCGDCAALIESASRRCPICRARFVREVNGPASADSPKVTKL